MKLKKPLLRILLLSASCSLTGCIHLDITPCTLDMSAMKSYCIPTNPKKDPYEVDLKDPKDVQKLHKWTAFSPDDLATIERALNK